MMILGRSNPAQVVEVRSAVEKLLEQYLPVETQQLLRKQNLKKLRAREAMEAIVAEQPFEAISLSLSSQTRCDGSARAIIGKSEAVAGVYGPLESKVSSQAIDGVLEVSFKAHSISASTQEDADFGTMIKQSVETCLKLFPRTTTSLSVRVLADEGNGFCAGVMAAAAALVDSGAPMLKVPVGIEVVIGKDGLVNFSPNAQERALARVKMLLIFCGDDEGPSTLVSHGVCSKAELAGAVQSAKERAKVVRLEMEGVFKEHVQKDKDLC